MNSQSRNLWNHCLVGEWKICQDLVWQIWAIKVGICEITAYLPQSPTVISQIPTLITQICQTRSWHIFHPATKQWFHRFLLWELIFGQPGLRRSILSNGNVIDSYSEGSYLVDQVLADLPPQVAISLIPTLRIHICQERSWQIYLTPWVLILQIPNLRVHIWITRSW